MYHTRLPNIISDINGDFRSTDMEVHSDSLINYTVFSLGYLSSTHPLFNLLENKTSFSYTFLNQYNYGGQLPMWEFVLITQVA